MVTTDTTSHKQEQESAALLKAGKSYQSIKVVEYPEEGSIDIVNNDSTTSSLFSNYKKKYPRAMVAFSAAVLATAAYSGRNHFLVGNDMTSSSIFEVAMMPEEIIPEDAQVDIPNLMKLSPLPQCYDANGNAVGPSGDQNFSSSKNTFIGFDFERKNGDTCPCSYVSPHIHSI